MKIYKDLTLLVGKTPLLELTKLESVYKLDAKILAKLEYFNPAGSVKDRIALKIADEYFSNYDVLEMTFDKFKNQMIHLQYDLNIKLYILQHLTAMIKNALFFIGVDNFTEKN